MRLCSTVAAALLLAAATLAAPTQDTLIVRAEDTTTAAEALPSVVETTEVTSQVPPAPLKMTAMEVTSEVALRYAHTTVLAHMRNPAAVAQEATFSLILPETAFISGFVMTLAGKDYVAYVKEKEEAKQVYEQAVAQGLGAAHVSAKARDSNHFTVRVNVEPQTDAKFNLTYEELLERRNGVYNHAINLNPGRAVPKLDVKVHIKEGKKISVLRVPEIRTGNEIDATEEDKQNPNAKIEKSADEKEATISFSPDVVEQQRLMDIYVQKTRESRSRSQYSYRPFEETAAETTAGEGVLGQFVIQYDVEHTTDGEIFLNDGYFVHFFSPPALAPLTKHVVFVLDTSGSMMDRKIIQLREAMASILKELNPGDYFNIVEFASSTHVYDLQEARKEPKPSYSNFYSYDEQTTSSVALEPPSIANQENIALAQVIVSRLNAGGGTNINEAMTTALNLVNRGVRWSKPLTPDSTTPAPAASPSAPAAPSDAPAPPAAPTTSTTTAPSSTAVADNKEPAPEPIIIFLTDGDPTVGEMDPKRIVKRVSELNTGGKRAAIFCLAFGEDADRNFLRKLSLKNEGFMRHIYEAADAAQQLRSFYRQVSSPLLARVKFTYPPEQVEESSLTRHKFHTLYAGGEVVVAGKLPDSPDLTYFTPVVEGFCGVRDDNKETEYRSTLRVPVRKEEASAWGPLERLWAYLTIKQKLDEKDAAGDDAIPAVGALQKDSNPEKEALRLALKYSFVTPLTSLVVVKPNATSAVDAESVDKKQPYPPSASLSGFAFQNRGPQGLPAAAPGAYYPGAAGIGGYPGAPPQFSMAAYPSALFAPGVGGVPLAASAPAAESFVQAEPVEDIDYDAGPGGAIPADVLNRFDDVNLLILSGTGASGAGVSGGYAARKGASHVRTVVSDIDLSSSLDAMSSAGSSHYLDYGYRPSVQPSALTSSSFMRTGSSYGPRGSSSSRVHSYSISRPSLHAMRGRPSARAGGRHHYGVQPTALLSSSIRTRMGPPMYPSGLGSSSSRNQLYSLGIPRPSVGHLGNTYTSPPFYPTTPRVQQTLHYFTRVTQPTTITSTSTTTSLPTPSDPLADYGLEEFEWVRSLLNATANLLTIEVEGKTVELRLARTTDTDPAIQKKLEVSTVAGCSPARTLLSGPSRCVYLPRCAAARTITAQIYRNSYCDKDGYAGVCCPDTTPTPTPTPTPPPPPQP